MGAIPAAALDPNIATLGEIPQPPLMGNVDPSKIDEIRRTVYVGNLNSQVTNRRRNRVLGPFIFFPFLKIVSVGKVIFTRFFFFLRRIYFIKTVTLFLQTTTADQLLEFSKQVGEVKFVRMAGDETQPTRFAFVEFADQNSVPRALAFNGVMFGDRPLK